MDSIWTIGHSILSLDRFLELLRTHRIGAVLDVRSMPASRRHPHFGRAALERALAGASVEYEHWPGLGGRRPPRERSVNLGLRDPGLRAYADYMQTAEFAHALTALLARDAEPRAALLCAEADPAHCHRGLLADALLLRGVRVLHIRDERDPQPHALHPRARLREGRPEYPGPATLFAE